MKIWKMEDEKTLPRSVEHEFQSPRLFAYTDIELKAGQGSLARVDITGICNV